MARPDATPPSPAIAATPWYRRYSRWRQTSHKEAVAAEERLLALCRTPTQTSDVKVGPGPADYMHTITAPPPHPDAPPLVAIPGYAAGSGHAFRIVDGLASAFHFHAVDLLGTGLSGRPRFPARSTEEAVAFFVESLEAWRAAAGLDRMLLMGHSMGGYLSTCYAARYPERVQHLLLVSPVGVGRQPPDWRPPAALAGRWTLRGQLARAAIAAWDHDLTPGRVIRGLGPFGPGLVARYARGRFQQGLAFNDDEVARFESYFYHILAARGSGEFALRHILAPYAWPRSALEERCADLSVPVTFFYGDKDWMDPAGAKRMVAALAQQRSPACESDLQILTTPSAGHYLFIDNPSEFMRQVAYATSAYLSPEGRRALLAAADAGPHAAAEPFHPPDELEEQVERKAPGEGQAVGVGPKDAAVREGKSVAAEGSG
ncbi:CGI58 [Auxenochlorella protothecoides x Auxenochlorella symbiontica]